MLTSMNPLFFFQVEETASKEVSLEYREKRMAEERDYLTAQLTALNKELAEKNEELASLRRDHTTRMAELQTRVAEGSEALRTAEGREEAAREDANAYRKRAEELADKLKAARDSEMAVEENYRQELRAQTKLAELYKGKITGLSVIVLCVLSLSFSQDIMTKPNRNPPT